MSDQILALGSTELPLALAELHRDMQVGDRRDLWWFENDDENLFRRTLVGAGFDSGDFTERHVETGRFQIVVPITKRWSLPDYVGADMQLLICGLNPSPSSADSGVGYFKAGNRFWPAALKAGLVSRDRDPRHALTAHGVGMTDMVKRPTRRADELDRAEYAAGFERLEAMTTWLQPRTICMVGLAGWRAAVNRKAQRGWQPERVGGRPVYLMPSTSGLNAHDTIETLTNHLRTAAAGLSND